jgi:hypothetical protein
MMQPELIVAEDGRFRLLLAAVQRAEHSGAWGDVERLREKLQAAERQILVEIEEAARCTPR